MQPPILVGTILQNRYRIINILGQGGFGRTYLAEDQRRFNEPCAIKELLPTATGTNSAWEKAIELFQREAEILYQIQHPQIPQFRERFEQDQRLFLVQDYVAGKTYRDLLEERKANSAVFTEHEALNLIQSLLPVLEHLHSRGIIHRDISPENIIRRDSDDQPVLIDFGVVKELATKLQSPGGTVSVTSVGKLGYAPSEQMQTGRAYPNSDLYALAVTTIVLLTGKEPQELYDDNLALWSWQRFARVSPRFAQVLNRMLSFIPGERFQNASEVAQALQLAEQSTPPDPIFSNVQTVAVGRRPDPIPQAAPNNRPNNIVIPEPSNRSFLDSPLAVGAIGAAVVVLAGFGSWALVSSIRNQPKVQDSSIPTSPQSFPSPVISEGQTLTPTPSPTITEPVVYSKRLSFNTSNIATAQGKLRANETIQYTFQGEEGQQLNVSLIQQSSISLTVLAPNREPVDSVAKDVTSYQGTLPFTGKYIIQLTPASGTTEADYGLTVGLEKPTISTPTTPSVEQPTNQFPTTENSPVPESQEKPQRKERPQRQEPQKPSTNIPSDIVPTPTPTPTAKPPGEFSNPKSPNQQLPDLTDEENKVLPVEPTPTPGSAFTTPTN